MNLIKRLLFLILIILSINIVFSSNIEININETSSLTKLLSGGYSLESTGTLEFYNPSNISKVYEFNLPLQLDALIGINKIDIDNSSKKFDFNFDRIKGYIIEPNETIKVGYKIFGILTYNIYDSVKVNDISILQYYVEDFAFTSNLIINLEKPQREDFVYNLNGSLNSTPIGNSTRLVTAGIQNPTDFNLFVDSLKIYRTDTANAFYGDGKLISEKKNFSINPFDFRKIDFKDPLSNDYSVYWMSTDFKIPNDLTKSIKRTYTEQRKKSSSGESSGSSGGGSYKITDGIDSILIKKSVDKTIIRSGEEFQVMITVANVNDFTIKNFEIYDYLPENYEIRNVSSSVKISAGKLTFDVNELDGYGTLIITYTLVNNDNMKGITYLKPSELLYNGNSFYSQGVLVINDILPDKKVFIQKEVNIIDDDFSKVTITVKNLGGIPLEDLLVVDNIGNNTLIKEISKIFFEKGVWKINELKAGEEWKVTYVAERNGNLDTLPNIYGVDTSDVYGTLISSEEVVTLFKEEPRTIEKVGMGMAVGLLIFYLLF